MSLLPAAQASCGLVFCAWLQRIWLKKQLDLQKVQVPSSPLLGKQYVFGYGSLICKDSHERSGNTGECVAVTVAGLQAVGLILIIAFLITPAAAARFWTNQLDRMLMLSALIGAASGWIGASLSAFFPRLPAGAVIVLVAALFFVVSMLIGTERGVMIRFLRQSQLEKRMGRQHLLRALYEILEGRRITEELNIRTVPFRQIRGRRTWSDRQLRGYIRRAYNEGLVEAPNESDSILLTETGLVEAKQVTRNHRLWEMYLIEYADVATSRVDRDADMVEHILGDKMVTRLENKLQAYRIAGSLVPQSPHPIHLGD